MYILAFLFCIISFILFAFHFFHISSYLYDNHNTNDLINLEVIDHFHLM
jgi:hypothetical protein